jgi:hypothetical protein
MKNIDELKEEYKIKFEKIFKKYFKYKWYASESDIWLGSMTLNFNWSKNKHICYIHINQYGNRSTIEIKQYNSSATEREFDLNQLKPDSNYIHISNFYEDVSLFLKSEEFRNEILNLLIEFTEKGNEYYNNRK